MTNCTKNSLQEIASKLDEFKDEFLDLIFNPDDRAFIFEEIMAWNDELQEMSNNLNAIVKNL